MDIDAVVDQLKGPLSQIVRGVESAFPHIPLEQKKQAVLEVVLAAVAAPHTLTAEQLRNSLLKKLSA